MSTAHPPKLATFLMERLAGSQPILVGDLQEEFRAGRSRFWYWREALHAIAWSIAGAVRSHPIRFLRAMVTLVVFNSVAGYALSTVPLQSLMYLMPGWIFMQYHVATLAWIALIVPTFSMTTWGMARLHPDVRVPATLAMMALAMFSAGVDTELQRLWANMPDPRFIPYLVLHVFVILAGLAALAIGGILLPVRPRRINRSNTSGHRGRTTS